MDRRVRQMKKTAIGIAVMLAGISLLGAGTPLLCNLWNVSTGRGYFIPEKSSVFSFTPLVMNEGSGEWWLYGEDRNNYYSLENDSGAAYIVFPKEDIKRCLGFISTDYRTWCINKNK